jgi:hypothetical protein
MKPEVTTDGRKIVYPIFRADTAEALILPKEEKNVEVQKREKI